MNASLFLGLRALRGRAGTGRYLRGAVAGIALGLVPLIVVLQVATGMIEGITARLLEVGSSHLQASFPADAAPGDLLAAAEAARRVPGVVAATAERQGTVLLAVGARSAGVTLRCVDAAAFAGDAGLHRYLAAAAGSLELAGPRTILLSAALARSLGVGPGDEVISVAGLGTEAVLLPRVARFTVGGVYETGYQELDKAVAYAGLAAAEGALTARGARALVGIKVADPFAPLADTVRRVQEAMGRDARLAGWRDLERARLASFDTTRWLLVLIMSLVTLVAAANVSSTVLMLVLERRQEIAILLALGTRPGTVARAFLAAGMLAALAGTAMGTAAGLLVAVNINGVIGGLDRVAALAAAAWEWIRAPFAGGVAAGTGGTLFQSAYYLQEIPVRIRAVEVGAAAAGTLLVAALAAWVPARRAGRLSPLEVLRRS